MTQLSFIVCSLTNSLHLRNKSPEVYFVVIWPHNSCSVTVLLSMCLSKLQMASRIGWRPPLSDMDTIIVQLSPHGGQTFDPFPDVCRGFLRLPHPLLWMLTMVLNDFQLYTGNCRKLLFSSSQTSMRLCVLYHFLYGI